MVKILIEVCDSLEALAESIVNGYSDDRTMTELWGWSSPPLNRYDLAGLASNLSERIKEHKIDILDDETRSSLEEIPERIRVFRTHTLPYLFNGNGPHAAAAYNSLIEWISATLEPIF